MSKFVHMLKFRYIHWFRNGNAIKKKFEEKKNRILSDDKKWCELTIEAKNVECECVVRELLNKNYYWM